VAGETLPANVLEAHDLTAEFRVDPERVTIRTFDGELVESRDDPGASFPRFDSESTRSNGADAAPRGR
jgi:hypothetical protein